MDAAETKPRRRMIATLVIPEPDLAAWVRAQLMEHGDDGARQYVGLDRVTAFRVAARLACKESTLLVARWKRAGKSAASSTTEASAA